MKRVSHQNLIPMNTLVKNRKQQYTFPAHVFKPFSLPFHKQLLQPIHGAAQLVREGGDFVERQIELPQ